MKARNLFYFLTAVYLLVSCSEKVENDGNPVKKELFSGYVQKGPFISGSSVSIQELDVNLDQTGRSYSTTIIDNSGNFEQKNIDLISKYVQLKADGYYFNEITGQLSTGMVTLYALVDIAASNSANVNVLTHLERARVEYLVKETKMTFTEAKKQAKKEVLDIFSMDMPEGAPESLNLTNNAILLAVSCILQGPLSTANMVELAADISADIRVDGKLDNTILGSRLMDNALSLFLPAVRKNLENKYAEISTGIRIPDFERYVRQFIENSTYESGASSPDGFLMEDSIFITGNKTFQILHGPCGTMTYLNRIGKNLDSALDSLIKLSERHLDNLTPKEYYVDKEKVTVDFNYDDREFYSINFRRKDNNTYIFATTHILDTNGNCFIINWCDD